jgi:hypothetical protein
MVLLGRKEKRAKMAIREENQVLPPQTFKSSSK